MSELNELKEKTEQITSQAIGTVEQDKTVVPKDVLSLSPHEQKELRIAIINDPGLTTAEKNEKLSELRRPYREMTKAQLLQTVRDFQAEYGREPKREDLIYQDILKNHFGPWNRMLEQAGTRPASTGYQGERKILRLQKGSSFCQRGAVEQEASTACRGGEAAEPPRRGNTVGSAPNNLCVIPNE